MEWLAPEQAKAAAIGQVNSFKRQSLDSLTKIHSAPELSVKVSSVRREIKAIVCLCYRNETNFTTGIEKKQSAAITRRQFWMLRLYPFKMFFNSLELNRPHSNVIELIFIAPTIVTSLPQPIRDYKCARNTGKGCWARVCIPTASMINTLSKEKMDKKKRSEREAFLS